VIARGAGSYSLLFRATAAVNATRPLTVQAGDQFGARPTIRTIEGIVP
jgi:hypothetical protein